MSQPPNQHGTSGGAQRVSTTRSFLKGVRTAPAKPRNLTKQTVSVYELPWVKLKAFLETRFPTDRYPRKEYPDLVFEEVPQEVSVPGVVFVYSTDWLACVLDQQGQICVHGA